MTHEAEGNRDAPTGQKAVVLLVCNGPDLSQDDGRELGAVKDANCGVASDYTQLLRVAFLEYLVAQSGLCLRRSEIAGHCVQNLQRICGDRGESDVGEDECLRFLSRQVTMCRPGQLRSSRWALPYFSPVSAKRSTPCQNQTPPPSVCGLSNISTCFLEILSRTRRAKG